MVVVYHVTIVAIGHGLLKKFWKWLLTAYSILIFCYSFEKKITFEFFADNKILTFSPYFEMYFILMSFAQNKLSDYMVRDRQTAYETNPFQTKFAL